MDQICLRAMVPEDRAEVGELIAVSLNYWYRMHGGAAIFPHGPQAADLFYEVYSTLDPGFAVVAQNPGTGRLMGSCFYHPRERHVSLGIMNVHPNYFGFGVARAMLKHITDFADREGKPVRLIQSTLNLDSFSLYNRAGFVPRCAFQDMLVKVPAGGLGDPVAGRERVREATPADVAAMAALEAEVSGITREQDYRFCIENRTGFWHASVYEGPHGRLDGFLISSGHAVLNIVGPGVARSQREAMALLACELDLYKDRSPLAIVPVECEELVRLLYGWGARNCELHFLQVRGPYQPYAGVSMPTFLLESS